MKNNPTFIRYLFILAAIGFASSAQAQTINPMPKVNDDWRFGATISGWATASWTTVSAGNFSKSSYTSISDNLNSAGSIAMFTGEAHKGNWGLMADLVYWDMGGSSSKTGYIPNPSNIANSIYAGVNAKASQTMFTAAGTYTVHHSPTLYVDALAGVRYLSSTASLDATAILSADGSSVSASSSRSYTNNATDPIVGFKGRGRIANSSWFFPFYADAGKGTGPNNKTWQALLGVGNAYSWGDVSLSYRAMYFEMNSPVGVTKFTNAGPQLSATINF